ncbi:HesA/MoeB/ThiF family protein [Pedobacter agri]|uniref:HesA/MoeB/ThiF family protein n=1 Tax=Pedobacter agri TaxID=454586 RepID=UPI00292E1ACB|nr:HesA/MoeB/ThiF family protein [Pedobacter agri]
MDRERYHRQLILDGFGTAAQEKLLDSSILVIGAGGLGCPALQYLTAAGIGRIGIADGDVVSMSNLHRQLLFATEDIGKLKVGVAAKRLAAINPEVSIQSYPFFVTPNNILDVMEAYDVVIDATDNFESRYLINDACVLLKKPLIFAAVSGYEGQLAIFNLADEKGIATNYRDLFPIPPAKGEIPNCSENGVIGVLPGIIGTMQAAEAIKIITGIGKPLINKILNYNLLEQSFYEIEVTPAPPNSYVLPKDKISFLKMNFGNQKADIKKSVIEIDISELQDIQQKENTLLIDVREKYEVPQLNHGEFKQFPMSALQNLLNEDIAEDNIVLICQHGIRSLSAAEYLHEKYGNEKNIYSLKGGIARWKNFFTSQS